mmetsp:Transcript_38489/g.106060  ORF Transcript_38489/g.106060 Transcript_38489/m.106060 type:complete len:239 (-) Transcript_38489:131-847(-)
MSTPDVCWPQVSSICLALARTSSSLAKALKNSSLMGLSPDFICCASASLKRNFPRNFASTCCFSSITFDSCLNAAALSKMTCVSVLLFFSSTAARPQAPSKACTILSSCSICASTALKDATNSLCKSKFCPSIVERKFRRVCEVFSSKKPERHFKASRDDCESILNANAFWIFAVKWPLGAVMAPRPAWPPAPTPVVGTRLAGAKDAAGVAVAEAGVASVLPGVPAPGVDNGVPEVLG